MKFLLKFWIPFVLIVCVSCGKHIENENVDDIIIDFYSQYENEGIDKSFDNIFRTNKWMNVNDSSLLNLKEQLKLTLTSLGEYQGYELVAKKSLGTDYILYSFLTKYERQPLRFTFVIYTVGNKSQLQNFKYDIDYDQELERAAEVYFLSSNY